MIKHANKTALTLLSLAISSVSFASEPTGWPDGRGGWTTELKAKHFDIIEHAYLENNILQIPRTGAIQSGCAFYSPKLPVFHDSGLADIRIDLKARWTGFIDFNAEPDVDLFRVSVATTSDRYAKRAYFHTGLMYKSVDYYGNNGVNHYIANTAGWVSFYINNINVNQDDEIWFKVCDIEGGTSASIRKAQIHTYPTQ